MHYANKPIFPRFVRRAVIAAVGFFTYTYIDNFTAVITDIQNDHIVKTLGDLNYRTPFELSTCLQQMIYNEIKSNAQPHYKRQWMTTSDGALLSLDHQNKPMYSKVEKLVVILHGLTGGSETSYIKDIVNSFEKDRQTRVICVNYPGISNTPLQNPKAFHAGYTGYLYEVLDHIHSSYPNENIYLLGTSMGANIITKFLTEDLSNSTRFNIKGFISISNPFFLPELERNNRYGIVNYFILRRMKNYIRSHRHVIEKDSRLDVDKMLQTRTFRDLDSEYITKVFGFNDVDEYYRSCSSGYCLDKLNVPTLLINARNDKLSPVYLLDMNKGNWFNIVSGNPNLIMILTKRGGHCCWFIKSDGLSSWYERWFVYKVKRYIDYVDSVWRKGQKGAL